MCILVIKESYHYDLSVQFMFLFCLKTIDWRVVVWGELYPVCLWIFGICVSFAKLQTTLFIITALEADHCWSIGHSAHFFLRHHRYNLIWRAYMKDDLLGDACIYAFFKSPTNVPSLLRFATPELLCPNLFARRHKLTSV